MAEEKIIPGVATEKESDEVLEEIRTQTKEVLNELLAVAKMKPGQILVVGCSSSEIGSYKIGSHSSETIGQTVYKALYEELKPLGIYLAAQCCEHLNRSLILEKEAAEKYGKEIVVDMICVENMEERIAKLEEIGVHGLAVHTGTDQQAIGRTPLDDLKVMSAAAQKAKISVAGGIHADTVKDYIEYRPDVLIVGGGICHAEDPAAAAKEIYMQLQ